jgi:hypothetical protein
MLALSVFVMPCNGFSFAGKIGTLSTRPEGLENDHHPWSEE